MAFFGFGQSADISIRLDDEDTRKVASIRGEDGNMETHFLFYDGENVSGEVTIALKKASQKLEHQGIRVDFMGQIDWKGSLTKDEILELMKFCQELFPADIKNDVHGIRSIILAIKSSSDLSYEFVKKQVIKFNRISKTFSQLSSGMLINGISANGNEKPIKAVGHRNFYEIATMARIFAYKRLGVKPTQLNHHYKPGASEVYGETTYSRLVSIIDDLDLSKKDVFADLGSGCGNVVLHVASAAKIRKVIGIELMQLPASIAKETKNIFKSWMDWLGKETINMEIIEGDFTEAANVTKIRNEATVILMNNIGFQSDLERKIIDNYICKNGLCLLNDKTRIITTKKISFAIGDKVFVGNNLTNVCNIFTIKSFSPMNADEQGTSWTASDVTYFLYTVNLQNGENARSTMPRSVALASTPLSSSRSSTPNISSPSPTIRKNKRQRKVPKSYNPEVHEITQMEILISNNEIVENFKKRPKYEVAKQASQENSGNSALGEEMNRSLECSILPYVKEYRRKETKNLDHDLDKEI
uniref:Histone-lysine N-methyltransferase, H3 lysine-79 specific n=1 Tax=Acrobeloides nanus TaxID=290746 RepID=A0A914CZX7_9BILA